MRLLLENSELREYLTPFGQWSKNPLEGKIFSSITTALSTPRREALEKFNLVFLDPEANQYLKLIYR